MTDFSHVFWHLVISKYKKTVYRVAEFPQCGKDHEQDIGVDTIHPTTSNFVLNAPECVCKLYISDNSPFLSCIPETTRSGAQVDLSQSRTWLPLAPVLLIFTS